MKISLNWLSDYIDVKEYRKRPEYLSQTLTAVGLEVESVTDLSTKFNNVVIGVILEKGQHPSADRLTLCQVSTGQGVVHQIVCGAKNHKAGDRVVVALPGAILPGNFEIKISNIRGVESRGMLASLDELGLSSDTKDEGILILPSDAPVGESFAKYRGLDDIVFEIKVTPNRSDCLSHFGLAREIAAIHGLETNFPMQRLIESERSTQKRVQLIVGEPELCPRYCGRFVSNVKVGPSPSWMKFRLESVGLKSINNVVDVTNYVMMELGQPLHAFDARFLSSSQVVVELSRSGEKFVTLDGSEVVLTGRELVIRDGVTAVALAGVVGGKNSGIQSDTEEIFLESAFFSASGVRRTSRSLGIETESAYRYSRGINPEAAMLALNRASELLQTLAGGEVHSQPWDFYPNPLVRDVIGVCPENISQRLGYKVETKDFLNWMRRLGCQVISETGNIEILPPTYRWDLSIEMDLIEEYSRLNGYDKIPEKFPLITSEPSPDPSAHLDLIRVQNIWARLGFRQAINFNFVSSKFQKGFGGKVEAVSLRNPISDDLDVMRTSLIPGLVQNLSHNFRHGKNVGQLFETGRVFSRLSDGYEEKLRLGLVIWGQATDLWEKPNKDEVLFRLKGALEEFLKYLTGAEPTFSTDLETPSFLHPAQSAHVISKTDLCGWMGSLHPLVAENEKIRVPVALAELDLDKIFCQVEHSFRINSPAKVPSVTRDLSFVLGQGVSSADVVGVIRETGGELLQRVWAYDEFRPLGEQESDGRSITYRMILQNRDETLKEEVLTQWQSQIVQAVKDKLKVSIKV